MEDLKSAAKIFLVMFFSLGFIVGCLYGACMLTGVWPIVLVVLLVSVVFAVLITWG